MKQYIFFTLVTVISYPLGMLLAGIIALVLPIIANDTPGQGMETGFRFFLFMALFVVLVCAGSFVLSKHLFATTKPALIVNGSILLLIFLLLIGFFVRG